MDPRLLEHYNRELQHVREMGREFAEEYPKIAGRLGIKGVECDDPYVERLFEGFAFLTARVQMKLESEFPRFSRHMLEMVYPHYLAPMPSMAIVQFEPDLTEGSLAEGYTIPRSSALKGRLGKGEKTACEYRTAHDVDLWPIELVEAEYFTHARRIAELDVPRKHEIKAGIRLRLKTVQGVNFEELPLDKLPLYLRGADELPMRLYEQLLANAIGVVVTSVAGRKRWHESVDASSIRAVGLEDDEALLPYGPRSFQGYRLLQEYFAFPQRYLFVELSGLAPAVKRCAENELDVIVLLGRVDRALQNAVDETNFELFCSPVINLFPKRTDRIHLKENVSEYHVVPDLTRQFDYEVYSVTEVIGHGQSSDTKQQFRPFYASDDATAHGKLLAYYTLDRVPRVLSSKESRTGTRSTYVGSDLFLSLVDANEAPYDTELDQLGLQTLCTNRDLPIQMAVGGGRTDFDMESGAPVDAVRCVAGPSLPRASHPEGQMAWRLISHLALNYTSIVNADDSQGATGLRDILRLYADTADAAVRRQIDGIRSIESRPISRRLPVPGPIAFGRGLEITVTLDEDSFEGSGVFVLGAVLDRFFMKYVSINSFTETVIKTLDRGEIIRWPTRLGRRHRI